MFFNFIPTTTSKWFFIRYGITQEVMTNILSTYVVKG